MTDDYRSETGPSLDFVVSEAWESSTVSLNSTIWCRTTKALSTGPASHRTTNLKHHQKCRHKRRTSRAHGLSGVYSTTSRRSIL